MSRDLRPQCHDRNRDRWRPRPRALGALALHPTPIGSAPCPRLRPALLALLSSLPAPRSSDPADRPFRHFGFDAFGPIQFHRSIGRPIARFVALGPLMIHVPPADWSFRCAIRHVRADRPPVERSFCRSVRLFQADLVLPCGPAAFLLLVLVSSRSVTPSSCSVPPPSCLSIRLGRSASRRPVLAALVARFSSRLAWPSCPALVASGCRRVSPAPRPCPRALAFAFALVGSRPRRPRLALVGSRPRLALSSRPRRVSPSSTSSRSRIRLGRLALVVAPCPRVSPSRLDLVSPSSPSGLALRLDFSSPVRPAFIARSRSWSCLSPFCSPAFPPPAVDARRSSLL